MGAPDAPGTLVGEGRYGQVNLARWWVGALLGLAAIPMSIDPNFLDFFWWMREALQGLHSVGVL